MVNAAWLTERIEAANRIFRPLDVCFEARAPRALPDRHARLMTRADRDALTDLMVPDAINVFVVRRLRDVDDPSLDRMGVHWHGKKGARYVILEYDAMRTSLAHELGHYFGNPAHTTIRNNVMSYDRPDEDRLTFTRAQTDRIRAEVRRLRRAGSRR